jgi:hypothetical protein
MAGCLLRKKNEQMGGEREVIKRGDKERDKGKGR